MSAQMITSASARLLLLNMPTELWWLVGDLLSLEDRVMLCLAHRKLYLHFSHARMAINGAENRQALYRFLLRLDRSLPEQRLCSRCVKFHPIPENKKRYDNPCNERRVALTQRYEVPRCTIQLVLRALAYRSWAHGHMMGYLTTHNLSSRGGHWRYRRTTGLRFRRLLMLFQGEQTFERLFGLLQDKPRDATVQEIEGLPCCCNVATQARLLDACRCALSHAGHLNASRDNIFGVAFRTSSVRLCDGCRAFKCSHCASEFEIELRRWPDLESDGFLVVKRYIDLGPVDFATSTEQFSSLAYPPYCRMGEVREPKHPLFRPESNLKAEWQMNIARVALKRCLTWISWSIMHLLRGADLARNTGRL